MVRSHPSLASEGFNEVVFADSLYRLEPHLRQLSEARLLIISDGAKGLISAAEQVFPQALRQRCTIHKLRNVLSKVSQDAVRAEFWDCFDTSSDTLKTITPGQKLVEAARATRPATQTLAPGRAQPRGVRTAYSACS